MTTHDPINHPPHYNAHPSGVEAIDIAEHMNFCVGNAIKYLWRAGLKNDAIEDLKKAVWYIEREIQRREKLAAAQYQPPNAPDVEQYRRQREAFFDIRRAELRKDTEPQQTQSAAPHAKSRFTPPHGWPA